MNTTAAGDIHVVRRALTDAALMLAVLSVDACLFLDPFGGLYGWKVAVFLVAVVLSTPIHWGLIHETIHNKLYANEAANRRAGRLLSVLLLSSWETSRFGHLLHHRASRHRYDRPEAIEAGDSWARRAVPYFIRLLGGGGVMSSLAPLLVFLPSSGTARAIARLFSADPTKMGAAAAVVFLDLRRRRQMRFDCLIVVALTAFGIWRWAAQWPVLLAGIAARWAVLSLLDNAPHYGMGLDSGRRARNMALPSWAQILVLGQNFHGIHHGAPHLRWNELAPAFVQSGASYDGTWVAAVVRQLRGPVRLEGNLLDSEAGPALT